MALKDIVVVKITKGTATAAQASFGYPLIASEFATSKTTTPFSRIRWYGEPDEMLEDGWVSTDPEYLKAVALCASDPTITKFAIGRKDSTDVGWPEALAAVEAENDDWYGLVGIPDGTYATDILAIAAWIESKRKVFAVQITDPNAALSTSTTDLAAQLKALGYERTFMLYHDAAKAAESVEARWMGEGFPHDPGSSTWAYKKLVGATPDALGTNAKTVLASKNCNTYTTVAANNITEEGKMASGEWIDIIIGTDFLEARLQETVFSALVANRKIPFDDEGGTLLQGLVESVLRAAAGPAGILKDESIKVTVPKVATISQADRAGRNFPDVTFTADYQGAIHRVTIKGTISV